MVDAKKIITRSNAAVLETLVIGGMVVCALAAIVFDFYALM